MQDEDSDLHNIDKHALTFLSMNLITTCVGKTLPSCCCVFFHSATMCVGLRSSSLLSVLLAAVSRKSFHELSFTGGTGADTFTSVISTPRASSRAPVWNPPFNLSDTVCRSLWFRVLLEISTPAAGLESGPFPEDIRYRTVTTRLLDTTCIRYRTVTTRLLDTTCIRNRTVTTRLLDTTCIRYRTVTTRLLDTTSIRYRTVTTRLLDTTSIRYRTVTTRLLDTTCIRYRTVTTRLLDTTCIRYRTVTTRLLDTQLTSYKKYKVL